MQLLNCLKKMDLVIYSCIPVYTVITGNDCLVDHLVKKGYFDNSGNFFALNLNHLRFGPFGKPAIYQMIPVPC